MSDVAALSALMGLAALAIGLRRLRQIQNDERQLLGLE